jgi:BirA family biotin operon repressor/biotin-[acetyl-CoA-carboxylase] ligase
VIVGIGLNVNNSFTAAPPELQSRAISLRDVTGNTFHRAEVLLAVLKELTAVLHSLQSADYSLQRAFSLRCLLTGRTIEIEIPTGRLSGICGGIDETGALLLETPAGAEHILSGAITKF